MSEFDAYARDYDAALQQGLDVSGESREFFARERIVWLRRCLDRIGVSPSTVLDYGCGTGETTALLLELLGARSVIGTEVSGESLDVARRGNTDPRVEFHRTSDYVPNGQVDVAYCNGVYHHVPPAERAAVTAYIAGCLRPGGVFALWENNPWSPGARLVMSRIPFDRDAIMVWPRQARALTRGAGLAPLRTDFCFVFPRSLGALRPTEGALRKLPLGAQYQVLARK